MRRVTALRDRIVPQSFPKELLINLTQRELKGKFKRSALGYLWSVINPVVNLAVYAVVFGVFFETHPPVGDPSGLNSYPFFLVCGLLPWTFLSNSLGGATGALVGNEGLVKKVYFPRSVLPASVVLSFLVSFLIELAVLSVALMLAGNFVLPWLLVLIPLIALQFAFCLGVGLALSVLNVYLRDVAHFLAIFLNVWFYATPVLYPADQPPVHKQLLGITIPVRRLISLNPMAFFVDAYRDLLYHLRFPTFTQWAVLTVGSLGVLAVGAVIFRRLEPRLAEEL